MRRSRRPERGPRPRPSLADAAAISFACLLALWLLANLVKTPEVFLETLVIGLTLGCVYALIALGYTLVYGLLELINFAHGDVFMLGSMFSITYGSTIVRLRPSDGWWLIAKIAVVLVLAMASCALVNATIELVAYRRLRRAPKLAPLITAIGASFIIEDVALAWKGPNFVSAPDVLPHSRLFSVGAVVVSADKLVVVAATLVMLAALVHFVQRTRPGKAMRAVAQDMDAAAMLGVNVNRTISFTFMVAGALAGAAGLLYAFYETTVRFDQGFQLGLIAFTAAVLGGVGNLPGAVLGAVIVALIQSFNEGLGWHAPGSDWTEAIVFSILILVLTFRPQGLLGEHVES